MTKRNQDFSKDILSLIRSSVSPAVLSERLQDFHENDLAEVLRELSTAERSRLYRILEISMLADVFEYLEEEEKDASLLFGGDVISQIYIDPDTGIVTVA